MKRRKKDEEDLRKEELLNLAYHFFLDKGFENFSMDDLAKKLGCARRSIYTYFKSKNDIYMALYIRNSKVKMEKILKELKNHFVKSVKIKISMSHNLRRC